MFVKLIIKILHRAPAALKNISIATAGLNTTQYRYSYTNGNK